jgi:predicted ATPase
VLLEREAFLDTLAGPPGRLILVGGEAGVGKTALVRAFAEGRNVLWGACDPLHTPRPLGPLVDIGLRETSPPALASMLLDRLRAEPGTILVLEDVHWADEGTLDVLRLLGRRIEGVPSLAIATFRDDEPAPLRVVLGDWPLRRGSSGSSCRRCRPRRCAPWPSRTASTPTTCTAAPAETPST